MSVGISEYAVGHLSNLVFLDLPPVGKTVTSGETFGEIESVKAVSDMYSPVSGEVIEVNEGLVDDLDQLKKDPWDAGWMIKVKVSDAGAMDALLNSAQYQEHVASQPE